MIRRHFIALLALLAALGALSIAGCQPRPAPRVTEYKDPSEVATGALTPLERGALRREVLKAAQAAVAAWESGDIAAMATLWDRVYVDLMKKREAEYKAAGVKRIREHEALMMEVTDLNEGGTEAIVKYRIIEKSRTVKGSQVIESPTNDESELQLTMVKKGDSWRILRLIGGDDVYK